MTRRLYLTLTPVLAFVVGGIAIVQGYVALGALRRGDWMIAGINALLSVGGVAIVTTLLRVWRQLRNGTFLSTAAPATPAPGARRPAAPASGAPRATGAAAPPSEP
jgi:hypothetical protein